MNGIIVTVATNEKHAPAAPRTPKLLFQNPRNMSAPKPVGRLLLALRRRSTSATCRRVGTGRPDADVSSHTLHPGMLAEPSVAVTLVFGVSTEGRPGVDV